jgi:hypothetical protein
MSIVNDGFLQKRKICFDITTTLVKVTDGFFAEMKKNQLWKTFRVVQSVNSKRVSSDWFVIPNENFKPNW